MTGLKFRVWDTANKTFHYFTLEELVEAVGSEHPAKVLYRVSDVAQYDRSDAAWQRFTGLKDKNGKEIYEGDVVVSHTIEMEEGRKLSELGDPIAWCPRQKREIVEAKGGGFYPFTRQWAIGSGDLIGFTKVIGNIYENPDLVK